MELAIALIQSTGNSLTDEHAITKATWGLVLATLLLVIVTLLLWTDSWKRGREQRDRWKREDLQRELDRNEERKRWGIVDERYLSELRPRLTFVIEAAVGETAVLRCLNLGLASFELEEVVVWRVIRASCEGSPFSFFPRQIIKSGESKTISVPRSLFAGLLLSNDLEFLVRVNTGVIAFDSEPQAYCFFFGERDRVAWVKPGLHEALRIECPRCDAYEFVKPTGTMNRAELQAALERVSAELNATCPNHTAIVLSRPTSSVSPETSTHA